MKISDLKQPYRRMAEYLADKNTDESIDISYLNSAFEWCLTNSSFWVDVDCGEHPPITEEIKKHFPPDFDFSGEEVKTNPVMQMLDAETQKRIYTQLVKEGNLDELPETCEFSESVELEVWDDDDVFKKIRRITGKYKGYYMDINHVGWNYAQLLKPKIDFSKFKSGDVVEVELSNEEKRIGWFDYADRNQVVIKTLQRKGNQVCNGGSCSGSKMFNLEKIKSITKIK